MLVGLMEVTQEPRKQPRRYEYNDVRVHEQDTKIKIYQYIYKYMRLRTNARVTALGPKKSKMQELIERHGLHYAKNLKDTMEAYNTKKASITFRKKTSR